MKERKDNGILMIQNINDAHHYKDKVQFQLFKDFREKKIFRMISWNTRERKGAGRSPEPWSTQ
ncbi:MAG: hypothetical protein HDQ93_02610 [Desulfovibrio sp.]|nr:hypothetical protein [Desulfovibrio sp.]